MPSCDVCGEVPRCFWTYGGGWWQHLFGDRLCPGCCLWAKRMGVK